MEHEAHLKFTKAELLEDFDKFYPKMNQLAVEFEKKEKSQVTKSQILTSLIWS